ncbi:MAG: protein-L-isoaspartate O-methyltransferase [Hyphomicrobiaceae bacterium]|nr:protein-L-isoaspartate O-methyltransferase [Hyphomicrobiaceae bacterium]
MSTNAAAQRLNMVESQVRPSDVTDRRVTRAMGELPREAFVPAAQKSLAYMDGPVPLASGRGARQLIDARIFAKMVQLARVPDNGVVLEVGAGTGYGVAVLARLAKKAVGVESDEGLAEQARTTLADLKITNGNVMPGTLAGGYASEGPYDAIIVAGAVPEVPVALFDQLKDGGRLVAIVGDGPMGKAMVWVRAGKSFVVGDGFDASAQALPGFAVAPTFKF